MGDAAACTAGVRAAGVHLAEDGVLGALLDERGNRHGVAEGVAAQRGRKVEAEAVHVVLLHPPADAKGRI